MMAKINLANSQRKKGPEKLEQTTAAASRRYARRRLFSRAHRLVNVQNDLLLPAPLPGGWKRYIHPEGQPYYHHAERKLLTEGNIERPEVAQSIAQWYRYFVERANDNPVDFSEIVLELDEENLTCKYYLIDHNKKLEYWLDAADTEALGMETFCNEQHLTLQLQEHYWTHCEYFPMHRPLTADVEEKIIAMLGHAITDQLTSEESTAPYSASDCERLIKVINGFKGTSGEKQATIARIYRVFVHSQFVNMYGQDGARLARSQSILDEGAETHSWVLDAISCSFFFGIPQRHTRALKELWVDRVVYIEHWRNFLQRLEKEWFQSIVLAGLFLVLDVVLIAVAPQVDRLPYLGIALSSTFALGAIVSGFSHIYRHQTNIYDNAIAAGSFLEKTYHPSLGHQPLSIAYSLPLAAALWSLAMFSSGLLSHVYGSQEDLYANAFLGVGTAVAATLLTFRRRFT